MKLEFEGTTDEVAELLAILRCFATVESIVEDEVVDVTKPINNEFAQNIVLFFTALSRGGVHLDSCQTMTNQYKLNLSKDHRRWSFNLIPEIFKHEYPKEVAKRCIDLGKSS